MWSELVSQSEWNEFLKEFISDEQFQKLIEKRLKFLNEKVYEAMAYGTTNPRV
jgi:hypothetical protein